MNGASKSSEVSRSLYPRPKTVNKALLVEGRQYAKHIMCAMCGDVLWEVSKCGACSKYCCDQCVASRPDGRCVCGEPFQKQPAEQLIMDILAELKFRCANPGCKELVSYSKAREHVEQCPYEVVPCANSGCKTTFARKDAKSHLESECKFQPERCTFCGSAVQRREHATHEQECPKKPMKCEYCAATMENEDIRCHLMDECLMYPERCQKCMLDVVRKDMPSHNCFLAMRVALERLQEEAKHQKLPAPPPGKEAEPDPAYDKEGTIKRVWDGFRLVICPECKRIVQQGALVPCYQCGKHMCYKCLDYCRKCKHALMCRVCLTTCPNCCVAVCKPCRDSPGAHCHLMHFFNFRMSNGAFIYIYDAENAKIVKSKFVYSAGQDALIDSVLVDRTIYISGGKCLSDNTYYGETVALNIELNLECTQRNLGYMLEARCLHRLIAVNSSQLFCIGGHGAKGPLKSCETYNIRKRVWTSVSSLSESRECPTVVGVHNLIYVTGGTKGSCNVVEEYTISANMWRVLPIATPAEWTNPDFAGAGLGAGAEMRDGSILLFGRDGTAYEFGPAAKSVRPHSRMPGPGCFVQTKPLIYGKHVFLFNNAEGGLANGHSIFSLSVGERVWKNIGDWESITRQLH